MSINYQDLLELIGSQVVMIHSLQRELQRLQMRVQELESVQQGQQDTSPAEDRDE